ncbi:MAG: addiction module protein [Verrucomicrobiales bacterium]|jgi:hypothetical protein|nr:addiction module protein [Verrucomicrobiales bacterium]
MVLAAEDVKKMSFEERLRSIEVLKLSLLPEDEEDTPAWHGEILAERLAKARAGKAQFITLEEAKARWSKRRK